MRSYRIKVNDKEFSVSVEETTLGCVKTKEEVKPIEKAAPAQIEKAPKKDVSQDGLKLVSPMPGTVLNVKVANGANVKKGDGIIVLEAMKMENEIAAPQDGVVQVYVNVGDKINSGDTIAVIA